MDKDRFRLNEEQREIVKVMKKEFGRILFRRPKKGTEGRGKMQVYYTEEHIDPGRVVGIWKGGDILVMHTYSKEKMIEYEAEKDSFNFSKKIFKKEDEIPIKEVIKYILSEGDGPQKMRQDYSSDEKQTM
jgi:hypothetical protein